MKKVFDINEHKKKDSEEELTLMQKVMLALASLADEDDLGSFVLLTDTGDGTMGIISDMPAPESLYLMEIAKMNLIMNEEQGGSLH